MANYKTLGFGGTSYDITQNGKNYRVHEFKLSSDFYYNSGSIPFYKDDFESDVGSWTTSRTTVSQSSARSFSGSHSLFLNSTGSSNFAERQVSLPTFNNGMTLSFWFNVDIRDNDDTNFNVGGWGANFEREGQSDLYFIYPGSSSSGTGPDASGVSISDDQWYKIEYELNGSNTKARVYNSSGTLLVEQTKNPSTIGFIPNISTNTDFGYHWSTADGGWDVYIDDIEILQTGGASASLTDSENFTFTVDKNDANISFDILVVGGGGGGGGGDDNVNRDRAGGGGGAGGFKKQQLVLTPGSYNVKVGKGGVGADEIIDDNDTQDFTSSRGGPSAFDNIEVLGGGRGGDANQGDVFGGDGASGGGGSRSASGGQGISGQGNDGANGNSLGSGGGGGAGSAATGTGVNSGGAGISDDITGSSLTYAEGGSGNQSVFYGGAVVNPPNAPLHTGSGGQGGESGQDPTFAGGANGAPGIVIIRYELVPEGIFNVFKQEDRIQNIYHGTNEVSRVFLGSSLVYGEPVVLEADYIIIPTNNNDQIIKVDSNGNQVWSYPGHTNTIYEVAVDQNGNVYSASRDTTVRKLDSNGNLQWTFNGHSNQVFGVAVDQNGNVYSAGLDSSVRKIDSNGNQLWSYTGHSSLVFDVTVDKNGFVYSASNDNTLRKLDSNGNLEWIYNNNNGGGIRSVDVGQDGFIYITANHSVGSQSDIQKIDPNGNLVWEFANHNDTIYDVAVDQNGNVYSAGADGLVFKIDSNGNQVWSYSGGFFLSVAVDLDGFVYIGEAGPNVYKLDSNGNLEWTFVSGDNNNKLATSQPIPLT